MTAVKSVREDLAAMRLVLVCALAHCCNRDAPWYVLVLVSGALSLPADFEESFGTTPQAAGRIKRPVTGVWNEIAVGGKTMQQAVSEFWNAPMDQDATCARPCPC